MSLKTRNAHIVADYQAGYSLIFLSDKYCLSMERVRQIVRDSGTDRRPAGRHYPAEKTAYLCLDCRVEISKGRKRCPECARRAKYRQTAESAARHGLVEVIPPSSVAHPGMHITPVPEDVLRRFAEWRGQTWAHSILNAGTVTQGQRRAIAIECEDEEFKPFEKKLRLPSRGVVTCPHCSRVRYAGIACRCGRKESEE